MDESPKAHRGGDSTAAREFLLADHAHFAESFWKNEESGESRVTIFTTLVAAVIAALVTLNEASVEMGESKTLGIAIFSLLGLLMVGIITLLRMIKRNKVTDEYKAALKSIRILFQEHFDEGGLLADYRPIKYDSQEKSSFRGFGGLAHLVAVLNAIVAAGAACLIVLLIYGVSDSSPLRLYSVSILVFVAVLGIQFRYIATCEKSGK